MKRGSVDDTEIGVCSLVPSHDRMPWDTITTKRSVMIHICTKQRLNHFTREESDDRDTDF